MRNIKKAFTYILIFAAVFTSCLFMTSLTASAEEAITVTISVSDKNYDGTEIDYSVNFFDSGSQNINGNIDWDDVDIVFYEISDLSTPIARPCDAGQYRISVVYDEELADPVYSDCSATEDFTINSLSVNIIINGTAVYGDVPVWNYQCTGAFAPGEDYSDLNIDFSWMNDIKDAGTHRSPEIPSSYDNVNYDATITWSYVINKKSIGLTIEPQTVTYGDNITLSSLGVTVKVVLPVNTV